MIGASLKNYHPKRTIPLMGTTLKSAFLWGRICSKPASSLSALGPKDLHGFVLCKRREQFLRLASTLKKDAPLMPYKHWLKARVYHYYTCSSGTLIRHEWGASFFDVGASLKNCSRRLQRTKLFGSFGPKANKLLTGLEQILPHSYFYLIF